MTIVSYWLVWSLISIIIGVVVWRNVHGGVRAYALIAVSCLYLIGIFVSYSLVEHIVLW